MNLPTVIQNIVRNKALQHALFWVISFYVLLRIFAYSDEWATVDLIYTLLFHFSLWLPVYVNLLWLIPSFLRTGKYAAYLMLLAIFAVIGIIINLLTFNYLSDFLFPGYYFIAYYDFWQIAQFILVYLIATTLIKLSKGWFENLEIQGKLSQLKREKSSAELSALKSQVNPHFLFNSLNNLYSLALDKDPRTPDIILRLSQTMRYLLYESNADFVPLEKEVEHLDNFVEMQKLRVGEKVKITFTVEGKPGGKQVAPLLFLPIVENGFKHGVKGETENAFISIHLQIADHQLVLKTENNKGVVDEVEKGHGGVGLENLRRRLKLIYPDKHRLEITDGIHTFMVVLEIKLT